MSSNGFYILVMELPIANGEWETDVSLSQVTPHVEEEILANIIIKVEPTDDSCTVKVIKNKTGGSGKEWVVGGEDSKYKWV